MDTLYTTVKEVLELVGLMAFWALLSAITLPLLPFAAPALLEWFTAASSPQMDSALN